MIVVTRIFSIGSRFWRNPSASPFQTLAPSIDPSISLIELLDISIETKSVRLVQQSHARALRYGLTQHLFVAQKLILSCCLLNCPFDAQLVFESLVVKCTLTCNTLLSGYGKNQFFHESIDLFKRMCRNCILPLPDEFTFSLMFKIVGDFGKVQLGKMVHGRSLKNGALLDTIVGNSLMSMYTRCGCHNDALKVFDEIPQRNTSSWNVAISMISQPGIGKKDTCLRIMNFIEGMVSECVKFDAFTISILLSLSSITPGFHGRELHSYIIKNALDLNSSYGSDFHLGCCLIDMYSKKGNVEIGRRIFDSMACKNVFVWTSLINGYVNSGKFDKALLIFGEMQRVEGSAPNAVSLVAILPACSYSFGLISVKQVHGFAFRRELIDELSLYNSLIDTYSKCGNLNYAVRLFDNECFKKDSISWCSIISAYGLHGYGQEALTAFERMIENGIKPDTTVVTGILSACCRSGLVNDGVRIYQLAVREFSIMPTVEICACLVDMFCRSGRVDHALSFMKNMPVNPSSSMWGCILSASGHYGDSKVQDLAYESLIRSEPDSSSNYISLSNICAASKRWDIVAQVRKVMREKGLRKSPGCSWVSINDTTHSFFVGDMSHPCSGLIRRMLDELVSTMMSSACYIPDFAYLEEH